MKGPLLHHTRGWGPVTITLQALSLVGKAEPVQARFTLRLRDRQSKWMQDGCEVYMDSYMALNRSCFMVTWTIFKHHLLEVGPTQNQETMALWTFTTVGFICFITRDDPAWIETRWNSIWLRARSRRTSHIHLRVRDHTTWFWKRVGTAFGHFLLGSHNVTVTAPGSCVKVALINSRLVSSRRTWSVYGIKTGNSRVD